MDALRSKAQNRGTKSCRGCVGLRQGMLNQAGAADSTPRPLRVLGGGRFYQPPRRQRMTGMVLSMMRRSSRTLWRRMYSRS